MIDWSLFFWNGVLHDPPHTHLALSSISTNKKTRIDEHSIEQSKGCDSIEQEQEEGKGEEEEGEDEDDGIILTDNDQPDIQRAWELAYQAGFTRGPDDLPQRILSAD
jgi:hypothetical protein